MKRSVTHATFVIERRYDAQPARVFAAWADPELKAQWNGCHDSWTRTEADFRVGGHERGHGGDIGGSTWAVDTTYQEIVPDQRIVFTYAMDQDGQRISVSVTSLEFHPDGAGTRLVLTEMGVFLDGHDDAAGREHGTREGLEKLDEMLRRATAA